MLLFPLLQTYYRVDKSIVRYAFWISRKVLYDLMERATSGLIYVNQADLGFEVTSRVTRDTLYNTLNSTTNDNIILKILIK